MNTVQYPGKLINMFNQWNVAPTEIMSIFKQVLCRGLGQVMDGDILAQHNIQQLASMPEFGNFEVENLASYPYTVTARVISYLTLGVANPNEILPPLVEVSAVVMLPQQIKGVIIYFHGTSLAKNEVPSNPDSFYYKYCLMLASQGYLVIAPDYIGQGINHDLPHPYFSYPEYQAISGLYLFKALRQFLDSSQTKLNLGKNTPSYVYGHSEGASSGAFFIRIIQNGSSIASDATTLLSENGFVLQQAFLDSGVYDFELILDSYMFNDTKYAADNQYNLGHVSGMNPYLATVQNKFNQEYYMTNLGIKNFDYDTVAKRIGELLAIQTKPVIMLYWLNGFCYYNNLNPDEFLNHTQHNFLTRQLIENIFQLNLDEINKYIQECKWSDTDNYTVNKLFSTSQNNMPNHELAKIIFLASLSSEFIINDENLRPVIQTLFAEHDNSLTNLINYDKLKYDPKFKQLLEQSQTLLYGNWKNNIPTTLLALDYDSVVNPWHSHEFYRQQYKTNLQQVTIHAHNFWAIEPCTAAGLWSLGKNDFPCFLNHSTVQPYSLLWMVNKLKN